MHDINFIRNKDKNINFKIMEKNLEHKKACHSLVDQFIKCLGE